MEKKIYPLNIGHGETPPPPKPTPPKKPTFKEWISARKWMVAGVSAICVLALGSVLWSSGLGDKLLGKIILPACEEEYQALVDGECVGLEWHNTSLGKDEEKIHQKGDTITVILPDNLSSLKRLILTNKDTDQIVAFSHGLWWWSDDFIGKGWSVKLPQIGNMILSVGTYPPGNYSCPHDSWGQVDSPDPSPACIKAVNSEINKETESAGAPFIVYGDEPPDLLIKSDPVSLTSKETENEVEIYEYSGEGDIKFTASITNQPSGSIELYDQGMDKEIETKNFKQKLGIAWVYGEEVPAMEPPDPVQFDLTKYKILDKGESDGVLLSEYLKNTGHLWKFKFTVLKPEKVEKTIGIYYPVKTADIESFSVANLEEGDVYSPPGSLPLLISGFINKKSTALLEISDPETEYLYHAESQNIGKIGGEEFMFQWNGKDFNTKKTVPGKSKVTIRVSAITDNGTPDDVETKEITIADYAPKDSDQELDPFTNFEVTTAPSDQGYINQSISFGVEATGGYNHKLQINFGDNITSEFINLTQGKGGTTHSYSKTGEYLVLISVCSDQADNNEKKCMDKHVNYKIIEKPEEEEIDPFIIEKNAFMPPEETITGKLDFKDYKVESIVGYKLKLKKNETILKTILWKTEPPENDQIDFSWDGKVDENQVTPGKYILELEISQKSIMGGEAPPIVTTFTKPIFVLPQLMEFSFKDEKTLGSTDYLNIDHEKFDYANIQFELSELPEDDIVAIIIKPKNQQTGTIVKGFKTKKESFQWDFTDMQEKKVGYGEYTVNLMIWGGEFINEDSMMGLIYSKTLEMKLAPLEDASLKTFQFVNNKTQKQPLKNPAYDNYEPNKEDKVFVQYEIENFGLENKAAVFVFEKGVEDAVALSTWQSKNPYIWEMQANDFYKLNLDKDYTLKVATKNPIFGETIFEKELVLHIGESQEQPGGEGDDLGEGSGEPQPPADNKSQPPADNEPPPTLTLETENELTSAQCDDGLDNDNDGDTDYPEDKGCDSINDKTEKSDDEDDEEDKKDDKDAPSSIKITDVSVSKTKFNPYVHEVQILYTISGDADVVVTIYNIKGEKVVEILNEEQKAGKHTVWWNGTINNKPLGKKADNGNYIFKITATHPDYPTVKDTKEGTVTVDKEDTGTSGDFEDLDGGGAEPAAGTGTGTQGPGTIVTPQTPEQIAATQAMQNSTTGQSSGTGPGVLIYLLVPALVLPFKPKKK